MSVNVHPLRDEPAGSQLPAPGAQYIGTPVELSFAIALGPDSIDEQADVFRFDPILAPGRGGAAMPPECVLETRGNVPLESLRRVPGGLEARFVNYSEAAHPLRVKAEGTWVVTDMTGAVRSGPIDPWEFEVAPGRILTLRRES